MSAEKAHTVTVGLLEIVSRTPLIGPVWRSLFSWEDSRLATELWGLHFKNPVGLAAGFDKNGDHIQALSSLGFGFIEVGTVTPRPQAGNPKPRLFRLKKDHAVINRMGFNNKGVDHLVGNLKKERPQGVILGGNIGKNKDTPNEDAWKDYLECFQKLYDYVDYFVVNLSSPNTPGLRELQEKEPLEKLLDVLLEEREQSEIYRPILLKIAPDVSVPLLEDILSIVGKKPIDGIIATNTTIGRNGLKTPSPVLRNIGAGGLSGRPLRSLSDQVIKIIRQRDPEIPIVGVGGIDSGATAMDKMNCGAQLIQVYSGLVYEGPFLIKCIKKRLAAEVPSK